MKVKLEFDLPDEFDDLMFALRGHDWYRVLWDLDMDWLRDLSKYQYKETVTIDEIRDKIRELSDDRDLNFD